MTVSTTVNEGTTSYVTASFYDNNDVLAVPTTIQYRIDCLTNNQQVKDWTSVTADSAVTITISSTENALINQRQSTETRVVTIKATYGSGDEVTEEYQYGVTNLNFIT